MEKALLNPDNPDLMLEALFDNAIKDSDMTPEELEMAIRIMKELNEHGDSRTLELLQEVDYRRKPPTIQEFIEDDYYMGLVCRKIPLENQQGMYPKWREAILNDFDPSRQHPINQAIFTGCIGCLSHDTVVALEDGSLPTLGDLIEKGEAIAPSTVDGPSSSPGAVDSGVQSCLEVELQNGSRLTLTPDHQVEIFDELNLTFGWKRADQLTKLDLVIGASSWRPKEGEEVLSDAEVKVLAYWPTDGSIKEDRTWNPETSQEVVEALAEMGYQSRRYHCAPHKDCWEVYVNDFKTSGFEDWARSHNLHRKTHYVEVPQAVCRSSDRHIALFLNRVWAAEGTVYCKPAGRSKAMRRLQLSMVSHTFIRQVQMLLLRLGINSRIDKTRHFDKRYSAWRTWWTLVIEYAEDQLRFLDKVGDVLGKESKCTEMRDQIKSGKGKPYAGSHHGTLPITAGRLNELMMAERVWKTRRWRNLVHRKHRKLTTHTFAEWLKDYGTTPLGQRLAKLFSGKCFSRVKSITDVGWYPVGDVSFSSNGSKWLANRVSVHNSGKTFTGCLYTLVRTAHALCLRNPLLYYGLSKVTSLVISYFSVTQKQVKGGAFHDCINMLNISPFFSENVRDTAANRKYSDRRIELDNSIVIEAGSQTREALGRNTLVSLIDEVNFRIEKDAAAAAQDLVNSIERRYESRFSGAKDGLLVIISSAKDEGDFLAGHIAKNRNKPNVVVHDYPIWETSGPTKIAYSGKRFVVDIGDSTNPPAILSDDEEIARLPNNRRLDVPEEYRSHFDDNLIGSIRDLGGVSTGRIAKYFPNTMHIFNSLIDSPPMMKLETVKLSIDSPHSLQDVIIPERAWKVMESRREPYRHPYAPRFVHIDISQGAMDALGISMVHPVGLTEVERTDVFTHRTEKLLQPVVEVDFSLAIVRDVSRELLDYGKIRAFIHWLKTHARYKIVKVSADLLSMSAETLMIFKQMGYEHELISVDKKKDPYDTLKQCIHENRFRMPVNDLFMLEALNLEDIGDKIDHPEKFTIPWKNEGVGRRGSKDITDSCAGAVFSCVRHPETMMMPRLESVMDRMLASINNSHREPSKDAPKDVVVTF